MKGGPAEGVRDICGITVSKSQISICTLREISDAQYHIQVRGGNPNLEIPKKKVLCYNVAVLTDIVTYFKRAIHK